ncbi:calcium/proton exchanger [Synechococcus sp. WC10meta]|jgi:Ca2+:H+ antiporter|uniref:calcium/proton exchanger n=1 Tax=Synechococcus sp. WC10meta TaxID=2964537 RepID=UPI0039C386E3
MTLADANFPARSAAGWQKVLNVLPFLLLAGVPLSWIGHLRGWDPNLIFLCAALAVVALAKFTGQATEEIAALTGPMIGGLVNATFGNATELILGLVALRAGLVEVVKASITGAIISNLLLVAGLAMLLGGIKFREQSFRPEVARMNASVMNLAVVALILPSVVTYADANLGEISIQELSTAVALVLLVVYGLTLLFSLKTHSYLYSIHEAEAAEEEAAARLAPNPVLQAEGSIPQILTASSEQRRLWPWVLALLGLTVLVALESELLVDTLETALEQLQVTPLFMGVILLPIIGNAAEHATAITVALKNKMDLSFSVALGSTMQIALFVAPLLVLAGSLLGQPMNFNFGPVELVAIAVSVLLVNSVTSDGRSNWLEGLLLLATYAILGIAFFFLE